MTTARSALVTLGVTGALLTLLALLVDTGRVGGSRVVALGRPLPWLHQDLAGSDHPVPFAAGLASPWESPIRDIDIVALLVDIVVLGLAGLALVLLVRRVAERRTRAR